MRYLRVRNWNRYQHYHDRKPTWIKLYVELQEKWEFMTLPDAAKAHVCGIFMLAARRGNRIPADAAFIGQQIGATDPIDLELLMAPGREFLEYEGAQPPTREPALAGPSGSALELLAKPEQLDTDLGTDTKRNRDQKQREQRTHPQTPAPNGAGARTKAQAAAIADQVAAHYRQLRGKGPPSSLVRYWRTELRQGAPEDALLAVIEAAAAEERREAELDAAERARWEEAKAWVDRHGGKAIVARAALDWVGRKRRPEETVDDALARWAAEGDFPREVLGEMALELYQLRKAEHAAAPRSPPTAAAQPESPTTEPVP